MTNPPDPADFVRVLAPALHQAAGIARALEGRVANRPKHGEATPVKAALTVADTASQEAVLVALHGRFPDVCVEAEEDTPSVRLFASEGDSLVVVDPIDGTLRFFLEGKGPYGVLVGLAFRSEYRAGLVALPREDWFFDAERGGGARVARGDERPREIRAEPTGDRVFISHDLPQPAVEHLRARGLTPTPACGGALSVAPLLPDVRAGLRLARNPRQVSIRGRIGALISEEAGALVRCETGEPFPRGIREPARALLVAADAADLEVLQETLAIADAS